MLAIACCLVAGLLLDLAFCWLAVMHPYCTGIGVFVQHTFVSACKESDGVVVLALHASG